MREPHVHLAYAPRGAGLSCVAFWVVSGADCHGWFTGAQADQHPARFFLLEDYYSTRDTIDYRSIEDDRAPRGCACTPARRSCPRRASGRPSLKPGAKKSKSCGMHSRASGSSIAMHPMPSGRPRRCARASCRWWR